LDIRLVDNMVDPIKDGFDVVFGTGPLQDSTLIARKVFSLELFLCASPDFVEQLMEPLVDPAQLNSVPFTDFGFFGPRKVTVVNHQRRHQLSPRVRPAPTTFRCASNTSCRGAALARCQHRSSAPTNSATAVLCPSYRSGNQSADECRKGQLECIDHVHVERQRETAGPGLG
jgi:DNA-binding transcriptional LysR family regulator